MKDRTMGRFPTLGEAIAYYSRDDICAVIYYQAKRWRILMELGENEYLLEPTSEQNTREKLVQHLRDFAGSKDETKRLWGGPLMHISRDRGEGTTLRYHFMWEGDPLAGWRKAFDDMAKVVDVLDVHDVFYQLKYSGNRSLHLMIPAESFPETFRGKPTNRQFGLIRDRLKSYLPMPKNEEMPTGLRVVYSMHPQGGLVSLPLRRCELPNFQPLMANIYTVAVDFDWFELPDNAVDRNEKFLHTIFDSQEEKVTVPVPVFEPQPVKTYTGHTTLSEREILEAVNSEHSQERVAGALAALIQNIQLPADKLVQLLDDSEQDALWLGMEMVIREATKMSIADLFHLLAHVLPHLNRQAWSVMDGYAIELGRQYQQFVVSTVSLEALCDYLASQPEITLSTAAAANVLAKLDWMTLENLPKRIEAASFDEWFEKAWVVCGSMLNSRFDPKPIFESAIFRAKTYEDVGERLAPTQAEIAGKIHQFESLLQLRNTRSQKKVQDAPLFQAAEALIQKGHDLSGIILTMLNSEIGNPIFFGAARLLTRFWTDELVDFAIRSVDFNASRNKSVEDELVEIGTPVLPVLIKAFSAKGFNIRYNHGQIVTVLGRIGDPAAVPVLRQALHNGGRRIRGQLVWALGQIGDTAALDVLIGLLNNDEALKVRQQVVSALGKIGTPTAVDALINALRDENQYVRLHAERALKQIGTPEAIKAVEGL